MLPVAVSLTPSREHYHRVVSPLSSISFRSALERLHSLFFPIVRTTSTTPWLTVLRMRSIALLHTTFPGSRVLVQAASLQRVTTLVGTSPSPTISPDLFRGTTCPRSTHFAGKVFLLSPSCRAQPPLTAVEQAFNVSWRSRQPSTSSASLLKEQQIRCASILTY